MDKIELNIGQPLRIKTICKEEHSGHQVTNERFLNPMITIQVKRIA